MTELAPPSRSRVAEHRRSRAFEARLAAAGAGLIALRLVEQRQWLAARVRRRPLARVRLAPSVARVRRLRSPPARCRSSARRWRSSTRAGTASRRISCPALRWWPAVSRCSPPRSSHCGASRACRARRARRPLGPHVRARRSSSATTPSSRSAPRCGSPASHACAVRTFAVPHEDVTLRTADGVRLAAWYVPSRNGAAIVLVHGGGGDRDGLKLHATMLARHGYGVLLYDERGRGDSGGRSNAFGWDWPADVEASVDFLERRGVGSRRPRPLDRRRGRDHRGRRGSRASRPSSPTARKRVRSPTSRTCSGADRS